MSDLNRGIIIGATVGVVTLGFCVIIVITILGGNVWIHF